jgi:hypothetical protein
MLVTLGWGPNPDDTEHVRIPVTAAAHRLGQFTNGELEASERSTLEAEQQESSRRAEITRARAATDRLGNSQRAHGPKYKHSLDSFESASQQARSSLGDLYDHRKNGVMTASAEAGNFVRRPPPLKQPSLLEDLAWLALDVATAGIAGGLGKRLEGKLMGGLTTHILEHSSPAGRVYEQMTTPSKAVIALFVDSVKDGVKRIGKGATSALKGVGKHSGPATPQANVTDEHIDDSSIDSRIAFFQVETDALIDSKSERVARTVDLAHDLLMPMLDTNPDAAIAAMNDVAQGVEEERQNATNIQAQHSAHNWIRYVAQSSLGSISATDARRADMRTDGDHALARIDHAATAHDEHAMASPDGLVDIRFSANLHDPTTPARVVTASLFGISEATAARVRRHPLLGQKLAMRVAGIGSDSDVAVPITVVRDEAGNLRYDDASATGWLARKAGSFARTSSAEQRGATKLMEELTSTPLNDVLKTDSVK